MTATRHRRTDPAKRTEAAVRMRQSGWTLRRIAGFLGEVLAVLRQRRDMLAATDGTRAVAEASWPVLCEGRDPAGIQAEYEALQERGRQRAGGA